MTNILNECFDTFSNFTFADFLAFLRKRTGCGVADARLGPWFLMGLVKRSFPRSPLNRDLYKLLSFCLRS